MPKPDTRTFNDIKTPVATHCPICKCKYRPVTEDSHAHEGPIMGTCLACFMFSTEMRLWIIRAGGREHMGDWVTGWLKEILANPAKHLNT